MEALEKALEKIPGLAYVFAIAALLMLENNSEAAAAIRVFVVAWLLYRTSSSLDWFFDLVYGPKERQKTFWSNHLSKVPGYRASCKVWFAVRKRLPGYRTLAGNREKASEKVAAEGTTGIYKRARESLGDEQWEREVKPWLSISKAARAFIVPFLLIAVVIAANKRHAPTLTPFVGYATHLGSRPLVAGFKQDFCHAEEKLSFLASPAIPLVFFLICSSLYVSLRLVHMNRLYSLVANKEAESASKNHAARSLA